jgi:chaperonin GroES
MYDVSKLRLNEDWVLVEMDGEVERTSGGIIKPDESYEHVLRTGTVVSVGPGKTSGDSRLPMEVSKGEGVLFIRFLADTKTSESLQQYIGKDHVLLKEDDVLLAYDRSEKVAFGQ